MIDLTSIDPYSTLEETDVDPEWHKRRRRQAQERRIAATFRKRQRRKTRRESS